MNECENEKSQSTKERNEVETAQAERAEGNEAGKKERYGGKESRKDMTKEYIEGKKSMHRNEMKCKESIK